MIRHQNIISVMIAIIIVISLITGFALTATDTVDAAVIAVPTVQWESGPASFWIFNFAIDSQDNVHILERSMENLEYTTNSNGSFNTQYLGYWGEPGGIIFDTQDRIHLSYCILNISSDDMPRELVYATNSGGDWRTQTVVNVSDMNSPMLGPIQIAVDSQDRPHIVYCDDLSSDVDLKYASSYDGTWSSQNILENADVGYFKMIIDAQDRVHVIFTSVENGDLRYATNSAGSWNVQTVDDGDIDRYSINFLADTDDHLHLCYNHTNGNLIYANNSAGSWSIQTIAEGVDGGSSMVLDSQNRPHIVYASNEYLIYATNFDGSWNPSFVDGGNIREASIALDSQEHVHIVYAGDYDIMYATNMEGPWNTQALTSLVPTEPFYNINEIAPILIDSQDRVHIVYYIDMFGMYYATFTPTIASLPAAPTALTATPGNGQVLLTWTAPADPSGLTVTGYHLYWSMDPNGSSNSIMVNGTSYLHEGRENGQTYYYTVAAKNAMGEGARSDVKSVSPDGSSLLPSAPMNLVVSSASGNTTLSWTAPSGDDLEITGYKIYRGSSPSSMDMLTSVVGTSYADTEVVLGSTYYYQVSAMNLVGEGNRSSTASVTVTLFSVPSVPLNLTVNAYDDKVNVSWHPPASDGGSIISGYKIFRGTDQGVLDYVATVTGTSFEDTSLQEGTTYYYRVAAVNEAGEGQPTSVGKAALSQDDFLSNPLGMITIGGLIIAGVGAVAFVLWRSKRP